MRRFLKITIFSSNQPRHLELANRLAYVASEVFFVSEVNTVFPGQVDDFFKKSNTMQKYFNNVLAAEKNLFGDIHFSSGNINHIAIKMGDLNFVNYSQLKPALSSDYYVVFGSSYIKGWLADFLVENNAINIHMGLSPYYRGSSCNFWAVFDGNYGHVGATIHLLSKGLDNGNILFHCLPKFNYGDSLFEFTMKAVIAAQTGLVESIGNKTIFNLVDIPQNRSHEIRYTRNSDFNDTVAKEFLSRNYVLKQEDIVYPSLILPKLKQ